VILYGILPFKVHLKHGNLTFGSTQVFRASGIRLLPVVNLFPQGLVPRIPGKSGLTWGIGEQLLGFEIGFDLVDEFVKIPTTLEDIVDEASVIHGPVPVDQADSDTL
jgi:hypothetical protein